MLFEVHAERNSEDKKIFYYDNETNTLSDANNNIFEYPVEQIINKYWFEHAF